MIFALWFIRSAQRRNLSQRFTALLLAAAVIIGTTPWFFAPAPALAFSNSWTFDTAGDFTYDTTKVQVTSGQAQLGRSPSWWDTTYKYRRRLTVTASSTAVTTSDTITVNYDTSTLTEVQADRDDLRIVYWNGSTNTNIDREYVANGLGAVSASPNNVPVNNDIRFKAQAAVSASGSDSGYYVYYGNAAASAGPTNLTNVYRYYEPFDGAGTWALTNGTGWSINSTTAGRLHKNTTEASDRFAADTGNGFSGASNWYFETTLRRTSGTNTTSIAATASIPETSLKGYRLTTFGSSANDMELWALGSVISQGNTPVDYGTFTVTTGTDYRITMRYQTGTCASGIRVSGWLDGTTRHDRTGMNSNNCAAVASNWNASAVMYPGAHIWSGQASYDDYKVWQYLNESIALGSEETTYPSDNPTITPTQAVPFTTLASFTETSTLNGGSIRYILSNDGGSTWLYNNGTSWVTSDTTFAQAATAATINTNASTFPTGSGNFLFRAFLSSNGTQLVQLDSVSISGNRNPSVPTLSSPANASTVTAVKPALQLTTTDTESEFIRYRMQVDTVSTFNSANLQTLDQTVSQTGWTGQDTQGSTAYTSGATATFTLPTALQPGTTYYWRAAAIDPGGSNTFTGYSAAQSFTTPATLTATGITASTITSFGATITWTTNRAASTTVEFGPTVSYGTTKTVTGTRTSHSVDLLGLSPNTVYHFRVSGSDSTGQSVTSADQTFTTLTGAISNIQVSGLTTTGALISWTTNVQTTSRVEYGGTTSYGSTATASGSTTSHQVTLTNLTPGTLYHYRVSGVDDGDTTIASADQTFTTLAKTVITNVQATPLTARSIRITWTTNHAADSKVRYGPTTAYGSEVYDAALVTEHSVTIASLSPNTSYHYEALSAGNTSTNDADATATSLLSPPTILEPIADASFASSQFIRVIGLAGSGQTVDVYVDGKLDGTTKARTRATGTGDFAYTLSKRLAAGTHTIHVTAATSANSSTPGEVRSITVVPASPAPTLLPPLVTDGRQPTVTIRGLARAGAKIVISLNGKVVATTTARETATGTGDFTATLSTAKLKAGTYSVTAVSYDANDIPSKTRTATTFSLTASGAVTPKSGRGFAHTVKGGDSLWALAEQFYGDGRQYVKLVRANASRFPGLTTNPSLILLGWILTVPK